MSHIEISDVKSTNDDAKFDADVKFGDKETSKTFTTQGGSQDVDAINQVADGPFIGSATLVPVNQEEFGRCIKERENLLRSVSSIKFHSWRRSDEN